MNKSLILLLLISLLAAPQALAGAGHGHGAAEEAHDEPEKGPNRGRMLRHDDFALELAIFETGVPPEYRVWATKADKPVAPRSVDLNIKLTRLGDIVDDIRFSAEGDYLRGNMEIYEPHSFLVTVTAKHQGKTYHWEFENFEGRTHIEEKVARAMGITTEFAGGATMHQTIKVYGELHLPPGATRKVYARFDGEITELNLKLGEAVKKGQIVARVHSDQSLKTYTIKAPMSGIITDVFAGSGEQTKGRALLEITSTDKLFAHLAVFPSDADKVRIGAPVTLSFHGVEATVSGKIQGLRPQVREDQARLYWLEIDNPNAALSAGLFFSAQIEIATFEVPLAVKRTGLQSFRDFTVVYAKVGEEYEVRMLELGRVAGPWVEVLGGLDAGTEYVVEHSFIIKADIEKSGASHDH